MKRLSLSLILMALMILSTHFGYAAINDDTIVIYLSFDEGKGKEVKDQSKYGNHGEIVDNTEWTDGKFKKAVTIAGENTDCVVVPMADSLKIEGEITMMAWVNSPGWEGSGDQWIDKNCHNGGEKNSYGMGVFSNGTTIQMFLGSGGARPTLTANQTPALNEWGHVAGTYDGQTMRTYLNGEEIAKQDEKFDFQGTNDSPLRVGGSKDRPAYTFNGAIDEVVIYKRALDEKEINNVMNNGISPVSLKGKLSTTWADIKN
jgi:hypothetical protein